MIPTHASEDAHSLHVYALRLRPGGSLVAGDTPTRECIMIFDFKISRSLPDVNSTITTSVESYKFD